MDNDNKYRIGHPDDRDAHPIVEESDPKILFKKSPVRAQLVSCIIDAKIKL
jgi:hypothetical protein